MTDKAILMWIHSRLVVVHAENPNWDYMRRLDKVIWEPEYKKELEQQQADLLEMAKAVVEDHQCKCRKEIWFDHARDCIVLKAQSIIDSNRDKESNSNDKDNTWN